MATMFPDSMHSFSTAGEERTYAFFRDAARPDARHLCWYAPDIQDQEPDFLLFSPDVGLVVFEVKDWTVDQIVEMNPHTVTLRIDQHQDVRANPLRQAAGYRGTLMHLLQKDGRLASRDPHHLGRPRVPLHGGVVFPNMVKFSYMENGLHQVIPAEKAFFWDDLHPQSDICSDPSGDRFRERLRNMFPPLFPFSMSGKDLDILRQIVFPQVRIEPPKRPSVTGGTFASQEDLLAVLDLHQESLARALGLGHRVLVGPSGSGKTLILVHHAAFLRRHAGVQRILLVCYNITLINYLRRLLSNKGIPLGAEGVTVHHFFDLCSEILGEPVSHAGEDSDYYRLVIQECLERLDQTPLRYDAVLVDEGQDFSPEMRDVVQGLLDPGANRFVIATDPNQALYSQLSNDRGNHGLAGATIQPISFVYRNTQEISQLATDFLRKTEHLAKSDPPLPVKLQELPPVLPQGRHGPKPEVKKCKDLAEMISTLADQAAELVRGYGLPCSEIAVLYTSKNLYGQKDTPVPARVARALESKGILNEWVAQDYRAKLGYDITSDRVTISTIHSAKGLDWAAVFLLGLDALDLEKKGILARNLVYVGITRAKYWLFVPYLEDGQVIKALLKVH